MPGVGTGKLFNPRHAARTQPGALRSKQQAETVIASFKIVTLKFESAGLSSQKLYFKQTPKRRIPMIS